ncbi:MAG: YCF48-related protein [Bacteroidota bacterium]
MRKIHCLFIVLTLLSVTNILKAQKIELLQQGKPTSIRGLSVVDDQTAWISGSKGYVAITTDAGKSWNWQQVKGYEQADFRDIEAFSDKEAIIMSSGTPAYILKTTDGGATWDLKYKNDDKAYFLDAMDFADKKHGFILGDPINNKFLLLETTDAGNTWHPFKNQPDAMVGEAAFAASGTCLRVGKKNANVVTGGTVSRYLAIDQKSGKIVIDNDLPIAHGAASKGAFSVSAESGVVVGGNYSKDRNADSTACYFVADIKAIYHSANKGPAGYQSCVEDIDHDKLLSTGTSGSNISNDGGQTWAQFDTTSYNVCRKAKKGKLVLLAGDRGKIAVFVP